MCRSVDSAHKLRAAFRVDFLSVSPYKDRLTFVHEVLEVCHAVEADIGDTEPLDFERLR